jgi:hypothetical protein
MPFPDAISSENLIKIRGSETVEPRYSCRVYLSACPNTNVYTARVNQSVFTSPLATLTYDSGTGTLSDVLPGMTILVSHTNDRAKAFWRGRVRKPPGATVLYINETSGARFDDNDYIFVLDDYAIAEKLARDVSGTMYIDWDVSFRQLLPMVYDLKSAYADWVDGSDVYSISFSPTCVAAAYGATIVSYSWDVGDGTITAGSDSTEDITATFPAGFRYIHFTATDSNGNSLTRHIPVWAHDPDDYPVTLLTYGDLSVSASVDDGYSVSLTAFDGVDTLLDQTLICAWCDETYNTSDEHIVDNLIAIGRLRAESGSSDWENDNQEDQVSYVVECGLAQLAKLRASSIEAVLSETPTGWIGVNYLTPWRVIHLLLTEFCTFAELHSYHFENIDTFRFPALVTVGQDIRTSIVDICDSVNAAICESASGECEIMRKALFLTTAERAALTNVVDVTTNDILSIGDHSREHFSSVGAVSSDGGGYSTAAEYVSAYIAEAPAGAPDPGSNSANLRSQILAHNQTASNERLELRQRVGNALAELQDVDVFTLKVLDGFRFLECSYFYRYTITLTGTETTNGVVLTTATKWLLYGKSLQFDHETGTIETNLTFRKETQGVPGEIIEFPDVVTGDYPTTIGDFDEPIPVPSLSPDDAIFDFTTGPVGWVSNYGAYSSPNGWQPACVGSTHEVLDIYREIGEPVTLLSITAVYDAVYAGGADNQNKFLCRLNTGDWVELHSFTTATGTGVTETVHLGAGVVATAIRAIMYAGGSDCSGSLTLTSLTYEAVGAGIEKTIWITFGDYVDPPYIVLEDYGSPSILSTGGNPGRCLDGGNDGNQTYAYIRLDLPVPSTVKRVQLDWWKKHSYFFHVDIVIHLYDQYDVKKRTISQRFDDIDPYVWYTRDTGYFTEDGISYVIMGADSTPFSSNLVRCDNCKVTYV